MPKKKMVDLDKLYDAIQAKMPSKEIMKKFGLKTSAQVKALYLDALIARGDAKPIQARGARRDDSKESKEIVVNKRGSLVVTRELVEEMGFKIEDGFSVRKTKVGVSLKKI